MENGSELLLTENEEKIVKSLNLDVDKLNHYMVLFSQWIASQPHLPQISNDSCRKKFLVWAKLDLEKAKKKFLKYCYNPLTHKEFVCDRVITLDGDLKAFNFGHFAPIPKLTPEGYRINAIQVFDPEKYNTVSLARALTLIFDYRLYKEGLVAGEIPIVNLASFKPHHYAKLFDIACLKLVKFNLTNYSFIIKHVLIFNCHSVLEKGINLLKSILPEKIASRMTIVRRQDLVKYVPLECLPEEFGGSERSIEYLSQAWRDLLMRQEGFFSEIGKAKPTGPIPEEFKVYDGEFGVEGSFRQLNID